MRPTHTQPILLPLLLTLVIAHPYPRDDFQDVGFGYLMPRNCASYCGSDNQFCCSDGEACTTSAGIASCAATGAGGGYDFYTTTWTETKTYTSTISSYLGPTTAASGGNGEPCVPPAGSGEIACGTICCANWQYCARDGQCLPNGGSGSWTQWTTVGVVTTQYSAPYRVTSGSTIVQTSEPTTTGTAVSETASSTSTGAPAPVAASTGGSLSGGAIAGIVVGTIAGVVLLLLLCFCCIVRGLWDVVAGILGFGGRRRKETERVEITEERYSRRGSRHGSAYGAAAARPAHRTWFGGGGGRPASAATRKEKRSSGGNWGWLAAGAGAAALLLGLRREDRRRASSQKPPRSDRSSSYFSESYTADSPSSVSSDRRTRDTRRSRQSRATRASRPSRVSRHSRT